MNGTGQRVVLVTGVSGGIGMATAAAFGEAGWRVAGVDRQGPPSTGPDVDLFLELDISIEDENKQVFEHVEKRLGRLDALINNAAIQVCKPLVETTPEEWDAIMASNLRAAFLAIRHAHPLLRASGGAVVNIGSVHAVATSAGLAAYAATKGGLTTMTRAAAIELAADGIRVNVVHPGAVDTSMLRAGLDRGHLNGLDVEERVRALGLRHPIGRIGRPDEIAQAIIFLADRDRSSFITGQALLVDGGATTRLSTE